MLEALKNYQPMNKRVAVYVPGTVDTDKEADTSEQVKAVAAKLSGMFGGATATEAAGYWNSDTAGLVKEKTTIVYSYTTTERVEQTAAELLALAKQIKEDLKQEAVSLEIDGALYLI